MILDKYLDYSQEIKQAIKMNYPIVALESTIISHGMPYPLNVKTAREVEDIIRNKGAVPATIGIIDGRIKIGLSAEELEYFGKEKDILKISRRDLSYAVSMNRNGATTVSGTMICAAMAGIKVFVTGGIGGVHRGVEKTWDISADLTELMQTNVAVVCAGVKSILDIKKTLEYLETCGVPVLGYKTNEFPAFYTRNSGEKVDYKMNSALETAKFIHTKFELGLKGGIIIANPVPEENEMDENIIKDAIDSALEEAEKTGIQGKAITPFLLDKIKQITGGKSLETNIALVKNNAFVGAEIALELNKIVRGVHKGILFDQT